MAGAINPPSSWFGQAGRHLHEFRPTMQQAGPSVIKSISQRGLLTDWRRVSEGRRIPDFGSFTLTDLDHGRHQLLFWHVVGSGYDRVFRSLFQGDHVVEGLGETWLALNKTSIGPFQQYAFATLSDCADRRVPVYSVISTEDSAGQRIDCERLLLPFGRDPEIVDLVLAAIQLVSNHGSFDRRSVMARFVAKC